MKDQLPSPDFEAGQYARPNQNWICGHAAEGKACRIGPDQKGRCRATFECQPAFEVKEGETKGRYRCTRTVQQGGPCKNGPLPTGGCSRPILKCVPVRSLRARRGLLTFSVIAFTVGALLIGLSRPFRARFISPGQLSMQHGTPAFAAMAGAANDQEGSCSACHQAAPAGVSGWVKSAFVAKPAPFQFRALAVVERPVMTSLDERCQHCHAGHSFHQPNVVEDHSCSACHQEHHGPGPMKAPSDANCTSCHASSEVMEASIAAGKSKPATTFDYRPERGRVLFKAPRPERGYTKIIHSFTTDHPEFQVVADRLKDQDSLKFNHELHLTSVTLANGKKLHCSDCHKPDAAGIYYLKISYEESCRSCHPLQFDIDNPGLVVPHGNTAHVRDFVRSLPEQYADYAARKKAITSRREVETFVQEQMKQLREQIGSGEQLERKIFFSDAKTAPVARIGERGALGASRFPGCAYCHTVMVSEAEVPEIAHPVIPDRWLIRARFDHAKHFKVSCVICHDAGHSRETSDILLPSKQTCVKCHSQQGGVAHDCSACHGYHSPRREQSLVQAAR
jgi:hypothetical protein